MLIMVIFVFFPPLVSLLLNDKYTKKQAGFRFFCLEEWYGSGRDFLGHCHYTLLHSTFITLSSFGLKAFSTTAAVEPGFENLCGSLDSNLLSTSCSLGFAPALPLAGNISFSSCLFLDRDHTLSQLGLNKPCSS